MPALVTENYLPEPREQRAAYVLGAGRILHKEIEIRQRRLGYHVLMLVERGHGWFTSTSQPRRPIGPGAVMLLFPGEEHTYGPEGADGWDELWISACGSLFRSLEAEGLIQRGTPVLDAGFDPELAATLARLVDDVLSRSGVPEVWAARAHHVWALAGTRARESRLPQTTRDVVARARTLLESDLAQPVDLEQVAEACGMSYERLRKVFTAATGQPPARWRLERRVAEARRLLADPHLALADIARRLGFADRFHFGRRFRQVAGVSPGAWRRTIVGTSASD